MRDMKGKPMFSGVKNSRCGERGYTLIDLAMALTIFGLLLAGVATGARVYMKDKQIAQTREYTRTVATAIENYVLEKGSFPCPGAINKKIDASGYGSAEACDSVAAGDFDTSKGLWGEHAVDDTSKMVVRGMVPFATLGLPEFYAYDAYGNRMQYAVTVDMTDEKSFPKSSGGGITIVDRSGDKGDADSARRKNHYVIFSSGRGEQGAWSRYGVQVKECGDGGIDSENCNTLTNSEAVYASARYSLADGAEGFDDIIVNRSTKNMPMWKPANDTGEDIVAIEDTARYVVGKTSETAVLADPSNTAERLRMDVAGEAAVRGGRLKTEKYCMTDDADNCFDPVVLAKGGNDSPFTCPSGYMSSVRNGKVECTLMTFTCPGHSVENPQYISGFDNKGKPECKTYNVTLGSPPNLVVGSCGSAHQQMRGTAPSTYAEQCETGTVNPAVSVSGGTWRWGCAGSGGGRNESCVAYKQVPVVNGACGSKNGTNTTSAPSDPGLCSTGVTGSVTGAGPWAWVCSGQHGGTNATCSVNWTRNGACGTAEGVTVASAPNDNLCAVGTATARTGNNPYNWTCQGQYGGSSASCASGPRTTVNGSCGTSAGKNYYTAPNAELCITGTTSAVSGTATTWTWSCVGAGIPQGTTASCVANRTVHGACGTSNGQNFASAPSTGLCNAGNQSAVAGSGPWTWSCAGINGGTNASCSANRTINAVCGGSSNTCSAGSASGYNAGSCGGSQTWTCNGQYGGSNASCSIANAACPINGSCGASNNTCNAGSASGYNAGSCGGSATWSCVGAHGGSTASCSKANAACPVNGSCGASNNTCNAGSASGYNAGSCGGNATWTCNGANGGSNASCSKANGACASNGSCGGSANTCNSGTASGYNAGSCGGSKTWTCLGANGGSNASCSIANGACAVNGSCGGGANTCNSGTASGYNAGSCGGSKTWTCLGANGGSNASCSQANGSCAVNGACPGASATAGTCASGSPTAIDYPACNMMQWQCVGSNGGSTDTCGRAIPNGCGGGGGGGCFTGTTEVTLEDGSRKPIAALKIGDKVKGHTQINRVESNKPFYVKSLLYKINGSAEAYVTANHPFFTQEGWKALDVELARKDHPGLEINQLKVGDVLLNEKGEEIVLEKFEAEDHGWLIVYNPTMDGDHTYYADGLLMHNLSQHKEKQ